MTLTLPLIGVCVSEQSRSSLHWVVQLSHVLELRHVKCLELLRTGALLVLLLWSPFHFFRCLQLPSAFKVTLPGHPWTQQHLFLYCLKIAQPPQTQLSWEAFPPRLGFRAHSATAFQGFLPSANSPLRDQLEWLSYSLSVFWMSLGHWYFSDFTIFYWSPVCCFLINEKSQVGVCLQSAPHTLPEPASHPCPRPGSEVGLVGVLTAPLFGEEFKALNLELCLSKLSFWKNSGLFHCSHSNLVLFMFRLQC